MMARVIQFDTEMLKDGYTPTEAMIYGYLRWISWKTREMEFSPSIWLMKKTLHLSRSSIIRGIQRLEVTWLIDVARIYREKNTYYIVDMNKYPAITWFDEQKIWWETKRMKLHKYHERYNKRVVSEWY